MLNFAIIFEIKKHGKFNTKASYNTFNSDR